MLRHRLSLPIGEKGSKRAPGGCRSKGEWFHKSRRLATLEHRLDMARDDWKSGRVRVARGGRRLLRNRHNLQAAQLTEREWRQRWEAERWFLAADGESGKRFGNETIRATSDGEVSIKMPAPLAHLANSGHGRYVLASKVAFAHRGDEWRDRTEANRAVAYRIHCHVERGRWYLTASWTRPVVQTMSPATACAKGIAIVAVDPAYTSMWGDQHWRKPLISKTRSMTRHDAASVAIGRRDLGHPIRRRTAPPQHHQSDGAGHRTVQAECGDRGREETRRPVPERAHDARCRTGTTRTRGASASKTVRDARSSGT